MQKDAGTALVAESVIAELCQKLKNLILQLAASFNSCILSLILLLACFFNTYSAWITSPNYTAWTWHSGNENPVRICKCKVISSVHLSVCRLAKCHSSSPFCAF